MINLVGEFTSSVRFSDGTEKVFNFVKVEYEDLTLYCDKEEYESFVKYLKENPEDISLLYDDGSEEMLYTTYSDKSLYFFTSEKAFITFYL